MIQVARRLVCEQHLRFRPERNAEVDQALSAIGQVAAFDRLDALETEEADEFGSLGVDGGVAVAVTPDVEAAGVPGLQRETNVFVDRKAAKQVGDLERAAEPQGRAPEGGRAASSLS